MCTTIVLSSIYRRRVFLANSVEREKKNDFERDDKRILY